MTYPKFDVIGIYVSVALAVVGVVAISFLLPRSYAQTAPPPAISEQQQQELEAAFTELSRVREMAQLMVQNAELRLQVVAGPLTRPGFTIDRDAQTRKWTYKPVTKPAPSQ